MQNAWSGSQSSMSLGICFQVRRARWLLAHQRTLPKLSNTDSEHPPGTDSSSAPRGMQRSPDHLSQPFPLFRNRLVPPALQFSFHSVSCLHAITSRPPLELESAHSFLPADHRKAQKGEGLRFTLPTFPPVECCVAPKTE